MTYPEHPGVCLRGTNVRPENHLAHDATEKGQTFDTFHDNFFCIIGPM